MKNKLYSLFFNRLICAGASQIGLDGRRKITFVNFSSPCRIRRSGMEISMKNKSKIVFVKIFLIASLLINLILGWMIVRNNKTYIQLPQSEAIALRENNPIDEYFQDKMKNDMSYAEIRSMQRLYGKLWKREYENVISWLINRCKYVKDQKTIEEFEKEVEEYIEVAYPTFRISYSESNTLDLLPDERMQGIGESALELLYEGEIYRDIVLRIIEKSGEKYTFLESDYEKVDVE